MTIPVDPADPGLGPLRPSGATTFGEPGSLEERLRAALAPNLLLIRLIGAGGMAQVFLAREPALKRLVAVKVLSAELSANADARKRFEREAQAVAALSHPNIVAVHGVGELDDGTPYFVMQHVAGRSMAARIDEEGPLPLGEARRALTDVAAALATAHQQGIIHRDIKPANILYEEATGRSLVSDFGIAAVAPVSDLKATKLTGTGIWLGTPQYMSPEQLLNEAVSEKTDIYSLGLLAHELVAGSGPFHGTTPNELIAAHLRDVAPFLSERRPGTDAELDSLIARCLDKNADKRPTATEVAKRLAPGGASLLEWPPPGLEDLHGKLKRVTALVWLGGALFLSAMLTLLLNGLTIRSALMSPSTLFVLLAGVGGGVILLFATRGAVIAGRKTSRALGDGYAWTTVLETLADSKGDSGNMIAGTRGYAALAPAQRSGFRRHRVMRALLLLASGASIVPLLFLIIVMGSAGLVSIGAVWAAVVIPVAVAAIGLYLGENERRAFAKDRGRRMPVDRAETSTLAAPWYVTFEAARADQALGRGPTSSPNAGRNSALAATFATVVTTLLLAPLLAVGAFGPMMWSVTIPKFSNTRGKIQIATPSRDHVLPKDSAISPLDAGRAFYALTVRPGESPSSGFAELPKPRALPDRPWEAPLDTTLFRTARPLSANGIPNPLTVLDAASKVLSSKERAYLGSIAAAPHWKHFDFVGRAPRMDYIGARFVVPFTDSTGGIWNFPIPKFSTVKDLAYSGVSRAAHHLAEGRRDSAEFALRSIVSVGFVMIDNSNTLIEELIGAVVVGIGRGGLVQYYKLQADPRGARLQARTDSVIALLESQEDQAGVLVSALDVRDPTAARARLRALASTQATMRGLRIEMFSLLAMSPCTNLRELVFGSGTDVRETYDDMLKTWARFPGDTALVDLIYRTPELLARVEPEHPSILHRIARLDAAILRNPRMAGCAAVLDTQ